MFVSLYKIKYIAKIHLFSYNANYCIAGKLYYTIADDYVLVCAMIVRFANAPTIPLPVLNM